MKAQKLCYFFYLIVVLSFKSLRGPRWWALKLDLGGDGPLQPGAGDWPHRFAGLTPREANTFFVVVVAEPTVTPAHKFSAFSMNTLVLRVGLGFRTGVLVATLSTEIDLPLSNLLLVDTTALGATLLLGPSVERAGCKEAVSNFCLTWGDSQVGLEVGRCGLGSRDGAWTVLSRLDGSETRLRCRFCFVDVQKSAQRLLPSSWSFMTLHLQLSGVLLLAMGCKITV